jgi:hypothetical protein
MALTTYTSYDEIRATLGVSSDEIEDTTLALAIYEDYLLLELEDISDTLVTDFGTVAGISAGSRTAVQNKFYKTTRLFAAFAVAKQLTASLPLFSPKDISDGKATLGRYADSPYKETIKRIKDEYDRFRVRLDEAHKGLTATATTAITRSYMSAVSPSVDPVTGS